MSAAMSAEPRMIPTSIPSSCKFLCGIAASMMRAVMNPGSKPRRSTTTIKINTDDLLAPVRREERPASAPTRRVVRISGLSGRIHIGPHESMSAHHCAATGPRRLMRNRDLMERYFIALGIVERVSFAVASGEGSLRPRTPFAPQIGDRFVDVVNLEHDADALPGSRSASIRAS